MKRKSHRRILSTLMSTSPNFQWISPNLTQALPSTILSLSLPSSMILPPNVLTQLRLPKCNKPPQVDNLRVKIFPPRKLRIALNLLPNSRNPNNNQTLNLTCLRLNMAAFSLLLFRKGRAHLGVYRITSNIRDFQHKYRIIKRL